MIQIITDSSEIVLPDSFSCPICGNKIFVDAVEEWEQDESGAWKAEAVKIDCVSFPGFDNPAAFNSFMRSHWSTPYVDWLPLEVRVTEWVNERYSWNLD